MIDSPTKDDEGDSSPEVRGGDECEDATLLEILLPPTPPNFGVAYIAVDYKLSMVLHFGKNINHKITF